MSQLDSTDKTQEQQIQSGTVRLFRVTCTCMLTLKHAAMETPSQNTEKGIFLSSASLNSEGINRTAAHREVTEGENEEQKKREESPD